MLMNNGIDDAKCEMASETQDHQVLIDKDRITIGRGAAFSQS